MDVIRHPPLSPFRGSPLKLSSRVSAHSPRAQKPPKPVRAYRVGDRVKVNPHRGCTVDAVIKAVTTDQKGRVRLQVEFGKDKAALVFDWQVCD